MVRRRCPRSTPKRGGRDEKRLYVNGISSRRFDRPSVRRWRQLAGQTHGVLLNQWVLIDLINDLHINKKSFFLFCFVRAVFNSFVKTEVNLNTGTLRKALN